MSAKVFSRALGALALPLALTACDPKMWLTDMKQQPSVGTWQKFASDSVSGDTVPFRGNPQGSVPVTGVTVAAWEVSYLPNPQTVDSMSRLANPVEADARSIENGHRLYQVNCAVCHGDAGDGRGKLAEVSGIAFVPAINGAATQARSDGYIWGMLRNGRGLMSNFNRIPERERWDVVNYVRGLQGKYDVPKGITLKPGEARAFSAVSPVAPNMPHAYLRPSTAGIVPKAEKPKAEGAEDHGDH
ncbi:cytochrome c [Pseudogemmatithrix spongiicola]|uniref:Cytochrome c n=1 Tax=Pseudogemmatithrix spongiicola TaxID=3062599 RepID=A0AA49K1G9_9BACT|nr:cytochrome c [Gemmatimonadaceae bacterium 'strain 138']WKW15498.1 cytochrome c [Gemmatimonadaceae bacterium 'strain 318']